MAKVINIRQVPSGWKNNPEYVYIGRAGKGHSGYFGNPHPVNKPCGMCDGAIHITGEALTLYRNYFFERVSKDKQFRDEILKLKDKILVCFCIPKPCHGQVICEYLENHDKQDY